MTNQHSRMINEILARGMQYREVEMLTRKGLTLDEIESAVCNMQDRGQMLRDPHDELTDDDLTRFHILNAKGMPTGVFDYAIFEDICEKHDLFILGGVPYIYNGGVYKADLTGAQLKTMIRVRILPEFVKSTTIRRIFDLFTSAAELQMTSDKLNNYPPYWVNFANGFYDPIERRFWEHHPKYRAVNQIPWYYDPESRPDGTQIEQWLSFAVPDLSDREMLLQYVGVCLTRDTRQQKCLILDGAPGSGKSTLIRLVEYMVGSENISNVSLAELEQRFASFGLMGKLLNSCADLEISVLDDVSTAKKLLGEDSIRAEAKGKDAISFRNYAKFLFSTNELPLIKSERTNGFFRRLLVLKMDNTPERKKADLFETLSKEVGYFLMLCVQALERMHQNGGLIAESENSKNAVLQMRCDSDSVEAFLQETVIRLSGGRIDRGLLFDRYSQYCFQNERQALTRNNFYKSLRAKGISEGRDYSGRFFRDVFLK